MNIYIQHSDFSFSTGAHGGEALSADAAARHRSISQFREMGANIYIYIHTHTHTYIYMYMYMYSAPISHFLPGYIPIQKNGCEYIYTYIYMYIYICIYTHTHTCIHMYIQRSNISLPTGAFSNSNLKRAKTQAYICAFQQLESTCWPCFFEAQISSICIQRRSFFFSIFLFCSLHFCPTKHTCLESTLCVACMQADKG